AMPQAPRPGCSRSPVPTPSAPRSPRAPPRSSPGGTSPRPQSPATRPRAPRSVRGPRPPWPGGKVVTPEEVHANVLEKEQPERKGRCGVAGGIGGDRAAELQQLLVRRNVCVERDLDDVINPAGRVGADEFDDFVGPAATGDDDVVSTGPLGDGHVTLRTHRRD